MSEKNNRRSLSVEERRADLERYKYQPSAIVNEAVNSVDDIIYGRIEEIDVSNAISYLKETSAINTSLNIQENLVLTRRLYPRLANSEEDLYLHMSDKDYLGRFSTPAIASVNFEILYNDFLTKGYIDPITEDQIFTIPKYFKITAGDYVFTTMTPIRIRRTASGVVDVRYVTDMNDEIFPLDTHYIDYTLITREHLHRYLTFNINLPEVEVFSKDEIVEKSRSFRGSIHYDIAKKGRLFYYVKAYHSKDGVNWEEMIVTHTDEVYNINTPTCIVRVLKLDKQIAYYIPPNYINSGIVSERVKFVVYTTKGYISTDFRDHSDDDFKTEYSNIFPRKEFDQTSRGIDTIAKRVTIDQKVIGGRDEKTFEELKKDVINNNLVPNLPITKNQMAGTRENTDLTPVLSHDTVTGREYLFKTKIPSSVSRYRVTRMSLDLMEYQTSFTTLFNDQNSVVKISEDVVVIPQGTLFKTDAMGLLKILNKNEADSLKALSGFDLVAYLNNANIFSLYYHYVLDATKDGAELRAYEIDHPEVLISSYEDYNDTTMLGINTAGIKVTKIDTGYQIDVIISVKVYDDTYNAHNITPYLVYTGKGGSRFFNEGKLYMEDDENPVFTFYLDTEGYIDYDDKIHVTNFRDSNNISPVIPMGITEDLQLIYTTNNYPSSYVPKEMDSIIAGSYIAGGKAVVTLETHRVKFADRYKYLYSNLHTSTGVDDYEINDKDVYHLYDKTVFNKENEIIHHVGETILDKDGNPSVKYPKGSVKLDENGKPVVSKKASIVHYLSLLLIDYKVEISSGLLIDQYKDDVRRYLRAKVLIDMDRIQSQLLERTKAFLTVPNNTNDALVLYDGRQGFIKTSQSFRFNIYVTQRVYEDNETRSGIEETVKETLDSYLSGRTALSKMEIINTIHARTSEFVRSISLEQLTSLNAEYIEIDGTNTEISISKKLVITAEGYDVEDDIVFNFVKVTKDGFGTGEQN